MKTKYHAPIKLSTKKKHAIKYEKSHHFWVSKRIKYHAPIKLSTKKKYLIEYEKYCFVAKNCLHRHKLDYGNQHIYSGKWCYRNNLEICQVEVLTLIRKSWEKSKTRDNHRARFVEKKSGAYHCIILYMFPCYGIIFRKSRSVMVPNNGIYFCSARHISLHIGYFS